MPSLIDNLTSAPRLRLLGAVCFGVWILAFVAVHASADGLVDRKNVILGRDFMAFYLAGTIVGNGQGHQLYEPLLQQRTQAAILAPETAEGFSYFINPASVAVAYSLTSLMPYEVSFYAHTLFMLLCFFASLWILKPHLSALGLHWVWLAMLAAGWMPMMHTITGGQNAALTFLLLSAAYAGLAGRREWVVGPAIGLLLFKPQFALPMAGLLLLRRRWQAVCVIAVFGVAHYVLGALACGWDWPLDMGEKLTGYYREAEDRTNSATHISLMEVLDYSVGQSVGADLAGWVRAAGTGLTALVVLYVVWVWRRADPQRPDFGAYWAAAVAATLLISPHTQYYDGALLILPVLLLLQCMRADGQRVGSRLRLVLVLCYLAYFPAVYLPQWLPWLRFQPAFLMPVGVLCWAVVVIGDHRQEAARELACE